MRALPRRDEPYPDLPRRDMTSQAASGRAMSRPASPRLALHR